MGENNGVLDFLGDSCPVDHPSGVGTATSGNQDLNERCLWAEFDPHIKDNESYGELPNIGQQCPCGSVSGRRQQQ